MTFLQKLIDHLYISFIRFKGGRFIISHPGNSVELGSLTVHAFSGYEITVYCEKVQYHYIYPSKWFSSKPLAVYCLYGKSSADTPESLKSLLKSRIYFPKLIPDEVSLKVHRRLLMEAYFDILIQRLKTP